MGREAYLFGYDMVTYVLRLFFYCSPAGCLEIRATELHLRFAAFAQNV